MSGGLTGPGSGPLDELAAMLVVPAKSGIYLTRAELIVLARVAEGSLRVSERQRMLVDVLKSPQTLPELSALMERLITFCRFHLDAYASLAAEYPKAAAIFSPWQSRTARTIERLQDVQAELRL